MQMSLYEQWKELAEKERNEKEYNEFWNSYILKEKSNYEYILKHHDDTISGKLSELSEMFNMENTYFLGFLDGINDSLVEKLNLDELTEESDIQLNIDFKTLYCNMLDAKAHWLYSLPMWDDIIPEDEREVIKKDFNRSNMAISNKVARNSACPCGSGKKYKKCCGI
ncbi:UNVERIFIED_CONTAM: hypothetical protein Cloal_2630 [Acetivibrio alkalicellulosi]